MHDFCTHCACTRAQHDLLCYVTGDRRCARCVRNQRTTCTHRPVNDKQELHRKGIKLLDMMLEDYAKKEGQVVADISYHDMMPKEEVQCYVGYDANRLWSQECCMIQKSTMRSLMVMTRTSTTSCSHQRGSFNRCHNKDQVWSKCSKQVDQHN